MYYAALSHNGRAAESKGSNYGLQYAVLRTLYIRRIRVDVPRTLGDYDILTVIRVLCT